MQLFTVTASEDPLTCAPTDNGEWKKITESSMVEGCKVPLTPTKCLIGKNGYLVVLNTFGRHPIEKNVISQADFNAMTQDDRQFYREYSDPLSSVTYLMTCHPSCKLFS